MPGRSPHGKAPLGADLVIPALALGFAVYFFFAIADLAWEAKANGVLIGTTLVVLIAIQIGRTAVALARGAGDLRLDPLVTPRNVLAQRIGMVLITAAFVAALPWLGLTLALFVAMVASVCLMGARKPWPIFWVSSAVAGSAWLMFVFTLESDVPHGPIERAIAALIQAVSP